MKHCTWYLEAGKIIVINSSEGGVVRCNSNWISQGLEWQETYF